MQRICHFLILCFTTAIFSTFAQDSVAPLATDFRVDESGAAVLSIPFDLPIARGESSTFEWFRRRVCGDTVNADKKSTNPCG